MTATTGVFLKTGRIVFSIGIAALGILCIIYKDFIIGRPPAWPENISINPALAYISGSILIIAAIAILLEKKAAYAALLMGSLIFLLSVLRALPEYKNTWLAVYKELALVGGALIVAASFYSENNSSQKKLKNAFIITGTILLAAFFIAGGYAHFKFADFVTQFIPSYIPFRSFWAYSCGIFLFAGGAGILIPQTRRLAALLSAIMLSGWFFLLHIPRFLANTNDAGDRMGLCESFTFAGIFFGLTAVFTKENKT
jgi:uncharacterized membrane protein